MNQLSLYEQNKPRTLELLKKEARHLCYKYGSVTCDSLRDHIGDAMPSWLDMRIVGAVLRDKKMFEIIGYTTTKRKSSHGRPIAIFRLKKTFRSEAKELARIWKPSEVVTANN